MDFTNYLTLRSSNLASVKATTMSLSTLTGSTLIVTTNVTAPTITASTITVSTINGALPGTGTGSSAGTTSTMISFGASTTQSNNFSGGSFTTGWGSTLTGLTAVTDITMTQSGQYQLAVQNGSSTIRTSANSGITWGSLTGANGLPAGATAYPQATASGTPNYASVSVSATGQYQLVSVRGGLLYVCANGLSSTTTFTAPSMGTPTYYLPMEGSVSDVVGTSAPTVTGSVTYVNGIIGSSAVYISNTAGGTADNYIRGTIPALTTFTLSGCFNLQTIPGSGSLCSIINVGTNGSPYLAVIYVNNVVLNSITYNGLLFYFLSSNPTTVIVVGNLPTIALNTWYSFTYIFSTTGTCYAYVNNILVGSVAGQSLGPNPMTKYSIGAAVQPPNPTYAFNGYIDDIRIYNSAVTFPPIPTFSTIGMGSPAIYLPFENSTTDVVGNSTVTAIAGSAAYTTGIVGTNALNLVNTAGSAASNAIRYTVSIPTTTITVSGWFNAQTLPSAGNASVIVGLGRWTLDSYFHVRYVNAVTINSVSRTGLIMSFVNTGGTSEIIIGSVASISLNTWYSFTCMYSKTGTCYAYLNNVLIGSVAGQDMYNNTTITTVAIGSNAQANAFSFNGYVDDVRIYTSAITYSPIVPMNWTQTAVSATGQYMLAAGNGLFLSSDYGVTWTMIVNIGSWTGLAISASGQYMAACSTSVTTYAPYYSTNYGVSWTNTTFGALTSAFIAISGNGQYSLTGWGTNAQLISNYLLGYFTTAYTSPTLTGINANIMCASLSTTGQYMSLVTMGTTNNVYYSINYGSTWTALTVGSAAMTSCTMSADGSYITVSNATTIYTLNRNTQGYSVAVGNQAGAVNQGLNAIAIGNQAGLANQSANSIVLNASGSAFDAYFPGLFVAPIATYTNSSAPSFSLLGYGTDSQIVQSSAVTVLQTGNVGINTTAPGYLLDVNGTSATRGVIAAPTLNTGQLYNYTVTATAGRWYKVISMPDVQSKIIFRIKGTVVAGSNPHACSYLDVLISTDNVSGAIYPQIKQTDSYNGMSWTDFGLVYVISSGYSTIYIKAAASVIVNLDVTATSKNGTGAISPLVYNSSSVYTLAFGGTMTTAIDTALTGTLSQFDVYTNTNVKYNIMVASTGNVGVGTNAPGYLLDVNGTLNVRGSFTVNGTAVATGTGSVWTVGASNVITYSAGNTCLSRNRLIFSNGVNDFNHSIYNNSNNLDAEGAWDGMKFNVYAGAWFRVGNASGATPTTALFINTSGYVGIGTTTVGSILTIGTGAAPSTYLGANWVNFNTSSGASYFSAYDGTRQVFMGVDSSNYGMMGTLTNHDMVVRLNNTERVRFMTTGFVGIGTTNPGSQLVVYGGNANTAITVSNGYSASFYTQYGVAYSAHQYSIHSAAGDTVIDAIGGNMILESQNKNVCLSVSNTSVPNLLSVAGGGTTTTVNSAGWGSLTNTQQYNSVVLSWTAPVTCCISSVSMYLGQGNNGTNISVYINGNYVGGWWPFQAYGLYVMNATGSSTANGVATTPTPFSAMNQYMIQAGQVLAIYVSSLQTYNYLYYGKDNTTGGAGFSIVYTIPRANLSMSSNATTLSLGLTNVGIGTTAPATTLDVNGITRSAGVINTSPAHYIGYTTTNPTIFQFNGTNNTSGTIYSGVYNYVAFPTNLQTPAGFITPVGGKYTVAFSGIYAITFTTATAASNNAQLETFIAKNQYNNSTDLNQPGTGTLASSYHPASTAQWSFSWTGYLSTTDFFTVGFFTSASTGALTGRTTLSVALVNRTA